MCAKQAVNVFIDTEAFERYKLDLTHPIFGRLVTLAREGAVRIFIPEVTVMELKSHVRRRIETALEHLRRFQKEARILLAVKDPVLDVLFTTPDGGDVCAKLLDRLGDLFSQLDVTVIPVGDIGCLEVLQDYFGGKAPFGPGKKKAEFPDAIAAKALLKAKGGAWNGQLSVVSGDPDWAKVCEEHDLFVYVENLPSLVEQFPDQLLAGQLRSALEARIGEVTSKLEAHLLDLGFYLVDADGDVEDVGIDDVTLLNLHVIDAGDGSALFEAEWQIEFHANVTYADPSSGVWDSEDHEWLFVEYVSGPVSKSIMLVTTVSISYEEEEPSDIDLGHIALGLDNVEIHVDEVGEMVDY